jgi:hypothetical protein
MTPARPPSPAGGRTVLGEFARVDGDAAAPARADVAGGSSEYARRVRLTDFWGRLEQAFGSAYARSIASDHSFSSLGGRTIEQAIAEGVDTATIWRAVVAAYPDRVPLRLR